MAIAAIVNTVSLRHAVLVDGIVSGAMGALFIAAAGPLSTLLGAPADFLFWVGVLFMPWMVGLTMIARQAKPNAGAVETVIALNALWVLGSIVFAIWNPFGMTALGFAFVVAQAITVAIFAELQFFALRREG